MVKSNEYKKLQGEPIQQMNKKDQIEALKEFMKKANILENKLSSKEIYSNIKEILKKEKIIRLGYPKVDDLIKNTKKSDLIKNIRQAKHELREDMARDRAIEGENYLNNLGLHSHNEKIIEKIAKTFQNNQESVSGKTKTEQAKNKFEKSLNTVAKTKQSPGNIFEF